MGFNFGAAFSGFADSFITGYEKGETSAEKRRLRKEKTRGPDSDAAARAQLGSGEKAKGEDALDLSTVEADVPQGQPTQAIAAAAPIPVPPPADTNGAVASFYEGGTVDTVEQSNGEYYRQEAQRAQDAAPRAAIPVEVDGGDGGGGESDSGSIMGIVNWMKNLGMKQNGAVPPERQGQTNPYTGIIDPRGTSYPDLTQTIGGIRQVTGAPGDRPLTTADHMRFLQLREQEFLRRGGAPDEAMKFSVAYLDNLRLQSMRTFALASAAWDQGDGKAVQFFVRQGWGLIPDGTTLKTAFKDGKLYAQQFDDKTNKPMGKMEAMDKNAFLRRAGDISGTTLAFGNHLADMDEQRKQQFKTGRSGSARASGKEPATNSVSTATGNSIDKLVKADPVLKGVPNATAFAGEIMATMPKGSVTDRGMPLLLNGLLKNEVSFVYGEADKEKGRKTGFYKDGALIHSATEATAPVVQRFRESLSKPASSPEAKPGPAASGTPAPGVSGATKYPSSATSADGPRAENLTPDAKVVQQQPPVASQTEAIPTGVRPKPQVDSRGRPVYSLPDAAKDATAGARAYLSESERRTDVARSQMLEQLVKSGKANDGQKQAFEELRAKLDR
jgi:hypothetical protein